MKYLITLKDSNIHVEPSEKPTWWHGDTSIRSLPAIGREFFEHDEYCTLEFDSDTLQMRVWHPGENRGTALRMRQPFSVYRKFVKSRSGDWRDREKTYQVSIYSDGLHTCECASWYFGNTRGLNECKHVEQILIESPYMGAVWEILTDDDREDLRESQSLLYDKRTKNGDGESA